MDSWWQLASPCFIAVLQFGLTHWPRVIPDTLCHKWLMTYDLKISREVASMETGTHVSTNMAHHPLKKSPPRQPTTKKVVLGPKPLHLKQLQSSQAAGTNLGVIWLIGIWVLQFLVRCCFALFPLGRGLFSNSCAMAFLTRTIPNNSEIGDTWAWSHMIWIEAYLGIKRNKQLLDQFWQPKNASTDPKLGKGIDTKSSIHSLGHSEIAFSITDSRFKSDTSLTTMGRPFY